MRWRYEHYILAFATLAVIGWVYWPLRSAGLVWDDLFYLHDRAWLRAGDAWISYALHGFPDWRVYFRPLGVALFTLQVRVFHTSPAWMHAFSLVLHMLNVLLVGALARRVTGDDKTVNGRFAVVACMLVYGLHPALIEPVAWISSQYDLLAVLFMLLGLWINFRTQSRTRRAVAVGICFFLAASSKESAFAFPLVLFLFDWMTLPGGLRALLRRQRAIYVSALCAGLAYLAVRRWGLGSVVGDSQLIPQLSLEHFQEVCFTYVGYMKLLAWPMSGLGPLHLISASQFAIFDSASLLEDVIAVSIAVPCGYLLFKKHPLGALFWNSKRRPVAGAAYHSD